MPIFRDETRRQTPVRATSAAVVIAAVLASACGGNSSTRATPTPGSSEATTSTASAFIATSAIVATTMTQVAIMPATITPDATTPGGKTPDATISERPPIARATTGSSSINLTRGSFVWNGVQADALHVTTSTDRLAASPGATIVVPNPAPWPLSSVDAGFVPAIDEPRTTEAGQLEWPYGAFTQADVASIAGNEVRVIAPQAPGTYVGTLFLRYAGTDGGAPASQVYYHFLVEIR